MLSCCNKHFTASYKFPIEPNGAMYRRAIFSYCPHCNNGIYQEEYVTFLGEARTTLPIKGIKAEEAFRKAKFNRLTFLERLKQGSREKMNWYWIDGAQDNWVRDFNGSKVFRFESEVKVLKKA